MTATGKFVIYQPEQDDYLGQVTEGDDANLLGWHPHPGHAIKFETIDDAQRTARRIADNNGYTLLICELHESVSQLRVVDIAEIVPRISPGLN